ncbi:hypothetical protein ACJX0J_036525, partial [Zea mays]
VQLFYCDIVLVYGNLFKNNLKKILLPIVGVGLLGELCHLDMNLHVRSALVFFLFIFLAQTSASSSHVLQKLEYREFMHSDIFYTVTVKLNRYSTKTPLVRSSGYIYHVYVGVTWILAYGQIIRIYGLLSYFEFEEYGMRLEPIGSPYYMCLDSTTLNLWEESQDKGNHTCIIDHIKKWIAAWRLSPYALTLTH